MYVCIYVGECIISLCVCCFLSIVFILPIETSPNERESTQRREKENIIFSEAYNFLLMVDN